MERFDNLKTQQLKSQAKVVLCTLAFALAGMSFAVSLLVFVFICIGAYEVQKVEALSSLLIPTLVIIASGGLTRKFYPLVMNAQNRDKKLASNIVIAREKKKAQAGAMSMSADHGGAGGLTHAPEPGQVSQPDED